MKKYICVDIGGTSIKYGIIDEKGVFLKKDVTDTRAFEGGNAIAGKVEGIIGANSKDQLLEGICISTAGMVDTEEGKILYSAPLIPEYTGMCWKNRLENRYQIPCEVENDVNCAGLAEYISGAARGSRTAVCLTIGTGIGGCVLLDGKVYHGAGGSAGEVGYMHMDGSDFQTMGAASILCRKVSERKGGSEVWNGWQVLEAAKNQDLVCLQAVDEMIDVLARGIANICYVLDPEIVVLGGGIMSQESFLSPRLSEAFSKYMNPVMAGHIRLAFAHHGNDAGMLGAFYHFCQKHMKSSFFIQEDKQYEDH